MDLGAAVQTWINILTHPGEEAFQAERERPQATVGTAVIWIAISAVIAGVLGWLQVQLVLGSGAQFAGMIDQLNLPPEVASEAKTMLDSGALRMLAGGGGLINVFVLPITFLIGAGIMHLLARIFGGTGQFGRFTYLLASFQAPIYIVNAIVAFVPGLGGCIAFLLWIYGLVLTFYAIKSEHALSDGRAIGVMLVPLALLILVFVCGAASLAGLFFSMQQGTSLGG